MQIFERLGEIIKYFAKNSQAAFARSLGILPTTFNGYMNEKGQERIRFSLLKTILEIYPDVNREWLLFGDGEMLKTNAGADLPKKALHAKIAELEAKVEELEAELKKVYRTNDRLINELADKKRMDTKDDGDVAKASGQE